MKKLLLSISLICGFSASNAQNLFTENFDVFPTTWTKTNQSSPVGTNNWGAATAAQNAYFAGGAFNGNADTSYAFSFFQSVNNVGTISNWLITPSISLQNGDIISFYSRKGLSGGATVYADRLEMRLSTNGAFSADPVGATGLGDYTTLALTINPALNTVDYPTNWTLFSYTVSGLTGPTDCRVAFRYFVTNGGISGANSDYVAIDAVSVDRPVANTQDFFAGNFAIQPNPVNDVFTLSAKNGVSIEKVEVVDINGRVVSQVNASTTEALQVNVSDLNSGVYFVRVQSDLGVGTSKIIKK